MIDITLPSSSQYCLHNTAASQTVFGYCSRRRTRDTRGAHQVRNMVC